MRGMEEARDTNPARLDPEATREASAPDAGAGAPAGGPGRSANANVPVAGMHLMPPTKRRGGMAARPRKRRATYMNAVEGRQKSGVGPQLSFLEKLMKMLEEENPDIVTWTAGGDSFVICDQQRFAGEVLPKYFRSAKWNSFQRQLNLYNFYVHNKTFDRLVYANPLFRRGRVDMIRLIKRSPVKRKVDNANGNLPLTGPSSPASSVSSPTSALSRGMGASSYPNLLGLAGAACLTPTPTQAAAGGLKLMCQGPVLTYENADHLSSSSVETSDSASTDEPDYDEPARKSRRFSFTTLRRSSSAPSLGGKGEYDVQEEEAVSALLGLLGQKNASLAQLEG